MKKFTDKLLHHHDSDRVEGTEEYSERKDRELHKGLDKDLHKDKEFRKDRDLHKGLDSYSSTTTTTTTTSGDLSKQHSFSSSGDAHTHKHGLGEKVVEKAHEVVNKALPLQHARTHTHEAHSGFSADVSRVTDTTVTHDLHEHIHEHINAPIVDTVVRATIVEETVRRDKVIEVQPIVHRHIEAPEVHHIERHLYEKVAPVGPARVVKQAVVEETIQPHITEDITTVLHREVPAPYVVHEEQHITEHQVKPTLHTTEIIEDKETTIIGSTKDVLVEELHTSDWEHQSVDRCPLALKEQGVVSSTTLKEQGLASSASSALKEQTLAGGLVEEKKTTTTTTTTTTTKPEVFSATTTTLGGTSALTESLNKVSLNKEVNAQGIAAPPPALNTAL